MPAYELANQAAIVSGAGQGMGRAIAQRLACEGATVVAADINLESASRVAAEIEAQGDAALALQVDVTSRGDTERMVRECAAQLGTPRHHGQQRRGVGRHPRAGDRRQRLGLADERQCQGCAVLLTGCRPPDDRPRGRGAGSSPSPPRPARFPPAKTFPSPGTSPANTLRSG